MSIVKEFKDFIMRGNVVDLAVGVVIGTAFTAIVDSMVKNIIMPPIGWLIGGIDFSNLKVVIREGDAAKKITESVWNYGLFIQSIVTFLIIAFCVFMMVKVMNTFMKKKDAAPPPPTKSEELLMEIRDLLKKK